MGVSTIGILKKEIRTIDMWNFIKENIDENSTVSIYESNRSEYINFNNKGEIRRLHVFMDTNDFKRFTNYSEIVTSIGLGNGGCSLDIIQRIVEHFGGWFIQSDCADENKDGSVVFYDFNEELLNKNLFEKKMFEKLKDEGDWKVKIKIIEFVKANKDFINNL